MSTPAEHRQRHADDDVVGGELGFLAALRVEIDHLHARVVLVHGLHLGVERDAVAADRALKAFRELVHAADRMKHRRRRRAVARRDRSHPVAEAGLAAAPQARTDCPGRGSRRPCTGDPTNRGSPVPRGSSTNRCCVLGGQRQIELVLIDRLDEQLVGVADHVGLDFAQPHALVGQRPGGCAFVIEVRARRPR